MGEPRAAAVYARISSDPDGTALGVARQVEDCRRLADELGWVVAEEYVDNDVSAFSGKRRPAYEQMLADVADGERDAVLVYHQDRLARQPMVLEQFLEVMTQAGVRHVRFVTGPGVDTSNGDGLVVLRIMGAISANESATKSRRVRRKLLANAEAGLPHGGSNRPFGFAEDRIAHRPDEAEVIRVLAGRYLAGESVRSLTTWLATEGVRTVSGKEWRTPTVSAMLRSARIAGLREHNGAEYPAVWAPIISVADRGKIIARMDAKATSGRRSPRRYLLSGLLRCERCGVRLYSSARQTTRRYVCMKGPDHGGCGRLTVVAGPLEELITAAVLYRLDTPEMADTLAGRAAQDEQAKALGDELAADKEQLDELAAAFAAKAFTMREWLTARKPIDERVRSAERRLSRMTHDDALAGLVGNGEALRSRWADLNLTRQHAIVAAVMDHAVIAPGTSGARELDPARVDPVWRL